MLRLDLGLGLRPRVEMNVVFQVLLVEEIVCSAH